MVSIRETLVSKTDVVSAFIGDTIFQWYPVWNSRQKEQQTGVLELVTQIIVTLSKLLTSLNLFPHL